MAVSDFKITEVLPRVQYMATALQTDFVIPFRFFEAADIKIVLGTGDPEDPADYTITGDGLNSNGTLTMDVGVPLDTLVTIYRDSDIERLTNFQNSGEWTAQNVNDQLNRLTTFIQEVALKSVDLAVRLPITSQLESFVFPDEGPTANANHVICWSSDGLTLVNGPTAADILNASAILEDVGDYATLTLGYKNDAQAAQIAAEAAAAGMKWRPSVRFATIVNDSLTGLAARNGITPIAGNRVLVMAQTAPAQNGVYIAAAGAWARATDADSWTELVGQVVVTEEASTVAGVTDVPYICTVNTGGTLGVTSVTWSILPVPISDGSITSAKLTAQALLDLRQIPRNSVSAAYTFGLSDGGQQFLHPTADVTARNWTIPANGTVSFPIGTAITIVNQNGAGNITLGITTDTLRWAGAGYTGSRVIAPNGLVTILKIDTTEWMISGSGLS